MGGTLIKRSYDLARSSVGSRRVSGKGDHNSNTQRAENQANIWLSEKGQRDHVRVVDVRPTDVVHVTPESGMQRFTLVIVYEVNTAETSDAGK